MSDKESICGKIYYWLEEKYKEVLRNSGSLTCVEPDFGALTWPLDEGAFLKAVLHYDEFYNEAESFIAKYFDDAKLFADLMIYQKNIVKNPWSKGCTVTLDYDFYKFYSDIYSNSYKPLEYGRRTMEIDSSDTPVQLPEYAKKVVWFGRKGGQNIIKKVSYK